MRSWTRLTSSWTTCALRRCAAVSGWQSHGVDSPCFKLVLAAHVFHSWPSTVSSIRESCVGRMQVNTAMLLKNLPPHLRNMIVKGKGTMPVHAAAAHVGKQPIVGSPKVLSHNGTPFHHALVGHQQLLLSRPSRREQEVLLPCEFLEMWQSR